MSAASAPPPVRDVLLRDGSTLRLRAPGPDDYDGIKRFFDELSPESRYMRFHGYGRTDIPARQYAEADGRDRVALIGRHGGHLVAAAGYDCLREPGAAEVAFAVADDFRHRGTATRLLEQLAAIASERGIRRFDAEVLSQNRPMLGVFRQAGFALRRRGAFGELTVSLDITPSEEVLERIEERDHMAVVASLRSILAPSSIAVVGASTEPDSIGATVLAHIVEGGFCGLVTPVNETGGVVRSMRAAKSLEELSEPPELVVIAVESGRVIEVVEQAAASGAKAILVLAAAAPDDDRAGAGEEDERLLEIVRTAGVRLLGPYSLGAINTDPSVSLNATFARAPVAPGQLAICSQSGAIGIGLLGHAAGRRLGVSGFASLGNRADVSTNDVLELWEEDERTAAVMLYVETFGNPERFARIARRVSRRKPILAVKGHRFPAAAPAEAQSHTAAALRGDVAVDALLMQAGVLRFHGGQALFDAAQFFASQPLPSGRRIGVVSNSAGVATLAVDACLTRGLVVGEVGAEIEGVTLHHSSRPAAGSVHNPTVLPIGTSASDYGAAVRALLQDPGIDALLAYYVDAFAGEENAVLQAISQAAQDATKPVAASVLTEDGRLPTGADDGVPNFLFPESCPAVIARAAERREWLSRPLGQRPEFEDVDPEAAREVVAEALEGRSAWLSTASAERLLATFGIPVITSRPCPDVDSAVASAGSFGGPVALKAEFPPPAHASDIDAVLLGLEGEEAVRSGWRELEQRVRRAGREWRGGLVQPLVSPGADVLVGTVRDPAYGPVLAIGLGGRQAGLGPDVAFRLLPSTDVEADELIDAASSLAVQLNGFRGSPVLDREALREHVLRFAALLRAVPALLEADLNPVRCMTQGCAVLDLRLRVGAPPAHERVKTW